jgi:anthranilate/para-aminobenzoate synthase component I
MKGTIGADVLDAERVLLDDPKETYEHNTIVDLIRNDLAMVAERIEVQRFRYVDRVVRPQGDLLQVSSEVVGTLAPDWRSNLGNILERLLPAGSISGAPKEKTCEVIRAAEGQERGYYTGIFGIYDGERVDSAVNIRYVERVRRTERDMYSEQDEHLYGKRQEAAGCTDDVNLSASGDSYVRANGGQAQQPWYYQYRSGGGITALSECTSEYAELLEKVYVPITREYQD